jgi:hypothetical protein
MNDQKDLHLRRLRESLEGIKGFRDKRVNAFDPSFRSWKERTYQSLGELFGGSHHYARRFLSLQFWKVRATVSMHRGGGQEWSQQDQAPFENDLDRAYAILTDALEEFPILVTQAGPVAASTPTTPPHIVVNFTNVLSQTTNVELSQVLSNLNLLGLSPDQLSQAKTHAQELSKEAQGEQRWPILAKSLEALKSMGKSVYENVALPLLLEMLKKQMGLNS